MGFRAAAKPERLVIKRVHGEEHLIADAVYLPLVEAERGEVEAALGVIGRLRDRALKAMRDQDLDVADPDDKVVFMFDYQIENGHTVVQVAQIAE